MKKYDFLWQILGAGIAGLNTALALQNGIRGDGGN